MQTPVYDLLKGNIEGIHPTCYYVIGEPVLIDPGNSETAKFSERITGCVVETRAQWKTNDKPSSCTDSFWYEDISK